MVTLIAATVNVAAAAHLRYCVAAQQQLLKVSARVCQCQGDVRTG
jgi:hypothetical protein